MSVVLVDDAVNAVNAVGVVDLDLDLDRLRLGVESIPDDFRDGI